MQQLMDSGEKATPEQMKVLRKYSGWGGLGKAFESFTAYTNIKPKSVLPYYDGVFDGYEEAHWDDEAKLQKAEANAKKPSKIEKQLRDAVVNLLRGMGIEVSTDAKEGQEVLDRVNNAKLSKAQKKILDTATMASEIAQANKATAVSSNSGAKVLKKLETLKEKLENRASNRSKTILGDISEALKSNDNAKEILMIPEIIKNGERKQDGERVAYTLKKNGVKYTVTTEQSKIGIERFTNFFTNKKQAAVENGTLNTDEQHAPQQSVLGAKIRKDAETAIENDEKITDKVRFFKTPDGNAYGFTSNGKIYIDPRIAGADTPIHEYGHLWCEMKRKTAPEEWEEIKKAMLDDPAVAPIIERLKKEYPELTEEGREDDFVEEVVTQFSGKRGAERLREVAEEVSKENGGSDNVENEKYHSHRR